MAGLISAAADFGRGMMGYLGFGSFDAGRSDIQETAGWIPSKTHPDMAFAGSGGLITERSEDLDRNSAWINGALDRSVEAVIGNGLQPWPTPIYDLLADSFDSKAAMQWGRKTRALYRAWAEDPLFRCDAHMRFSVGLLTRLAYLNFRRGGEAIAELRKDNRGATNPLNVLLIDPKRLRNPMGVPDTDPMIRNGVERGPNGAPIALHILKRHPDDPAPDFGRMQTERIPMRTTTGTPKMIHIINPRYIEQTRGFSKLAESMVPAKMLERYDRAEINAALLNAVMGFFIKSPGTPEDLAEMVAPGSTLTEGNALNEYVNYRGQNPIRQVGDAFIRQLLPDEDVVTVQPTHPNAVYPEFQKAQLAKIAASHGLSYPQISQQWDGINYSSARAMLNEIWRGMLQERDYFAQNFVHPIYVAWIEEEVAAGRIKVPGGPAKLYSNLSAVTNCRWIGPARGTVDPQKESMAKNLDSAAHRVSPVELALEEGKDIFQILDDVAIYREALADRELPEPNYNTKAGADAGASDGSGDPAGTEQDRDGDGVPMEDKKPKPATKKRQPA